MATGNISSTGLTVSISRGGPCLAEAQGLPQSRTPNIASGFCEMSSLRGRANNTFKALFFPLQPILLYANKGSGRLGNLNNVHQVADTHFAFEEKIQQAQPCPIRNSSEFQFRVRQGVGHSFPLSLLFVPEESSVEGEKPIRHDSTARKFGPSFLYFHFF